MPRARQTDASKLSDFRAPRFIRSQPSPSRTSRPRRGPESQGGSTARRSADRAGRSGSCKSRAVKDRVARQPFPDIYRHTDDGAVVSFNASARGSQLHRQAVVAVHWRDTRVEPPHVDRHHAARFHCLRVLQAAQDEADPMRFWDTSDCLFQADGIAEDLCYRGHVPAQRLPEDVVRVREWRSVRPRKCWMQGDVRACEKCVSTCVGKPRCSGSFVSSGVV